MKLAVIAANGRAGKAFVLAALAAGYDVRAGVRGIHAFDSHRNLTIIECDATDKAQVAELIKGADAVVSLIGHVKGSPVDVQTEAMKIILDAMKDQKINRLVSLTGSGARMPGDRISIVDRFLNMGVKIVDPDRIMDGIHHLEVLQSSTAEWTVIRVLKLTNTKPQTFKLRLHGPAKTLVARDEVAQAILTVLQEHSFIRKAPIIGKA